MKNYDYVRAYNALTPRTQKLIRLIAEYELFSGDSFSWYDVKCFVPLVKEAIVFLGEPVDRYSRGGK